MHGHTVLPSSQAPHAAVLRFHQRLGGATAAPPCLGHSCTATLFSPPPTGIRSVQATPQSQSEVSARSTQHSVPVTAIVVKLVVVGKARGLISSLLSHTTDEEEAGSIIGSCDDDHCNAMNRNV